MREILAEWTRLGGSTFVNSDRLVGTPLTLQFTHQPEKEVMALAAASGRGLRARTAPRGNHRRVEFRGRLHPADEQSVGGRIHSAAGDAVSAAVAVLHGGIPRRRDPASRPRRRSAAASARHATTWTATSTWIPAGHGGWQWRRRSSDRDSTSGDVAANDGRTRRQPGHRRQLTYNSGHEPAVIRLTDG